MTENDAESLCLKCEDEEVSVCTAHARVHSIVKTRFGLGVP